MVSASPFARGTPAYSRSLDAQRKFKTWRKNKSRSGNRRIPEELWECAAQLAAVTTVSQVSRFLSLDFNQLKTRVALAFGDDCPALSRKYQRKISKVAESQPSHISHGCSEEPKIQVVPTSDCPTSAHEKSQGISQQGPSVEPAVSITFPLAGTSAKAPKQAPPIDGVLEISTSFSGQTLAYR